MKTNTSRSILTASAAILCALTVTSARADTFGSGGNAFTIDFVNIGNAGNADDAGAGGGIYSSPYGGVAYSFRMQTTEVTQSQITKATAGGLANVTAGPWTGSQPATIMTWFEAAAFVNWLNDQRTPGLKAYQLDVGLTTLTPWASGDAWQFGGENLYRHKDAYYFLPSEDEWFKAAFHKNDGVTANYWDYATGSNSIPTAVASGTTAGTAVYNGVTGSPAAVNNDGGLSAYGTMGQNGNVWEWAESAFDGINNSSSEDRAIRGGAYSSSGDTLRSSFRSFGTPADSFDSIGFRVASVPEPSSTVLMISAGLLAIARRRRRAAV
jgi:formylglycine-generating enzyme required for sulfatase activity